MKELRGQSFSLSYPANWQAYGGNDSDSVTIAPQNGIVQEANQNAAVGYGAIVSYFFPDNNRAEDLCRSIEILPAQAGISFRIVAIDFQSPLVFRRYFGPVTHAAEPTVQGNILPVQISQEAVGLGGLFMGECPL